MQPQTIESVVVGFCVGAAIITAGIVIALVRWALRINEIVEILEQIRDRLPERPQAEE